MVEDTLIRRIKPEDIFFLSEIDSKSYEGRFWSEDEFLTKLRLPEQLGYVITLDNLVVAYLLYRIYQNAVVVTRLGVEPIFRRKGLGSSLIKKISDKLNLRSQDRILMVIRETLLESQLFLKENNFKVTTIRKKFFEDNDEHGYQFRYLIEKKK